MLLFNNRRDTTFKPLIVVSIRAAGSLLQLGLIVVLARTIGQAGVGIYSIFLGCMTLGAALVSIGTPTYVLKGIAAVERTPFAIRRLLIGGILLVISVWLIVVITGIAAYASGIVFPVSGTVTIYVLCASLLHAVLRLSAAALKGAGYAAIGIMYEFCVVPGVVLTTVSIAAVTSMEISTIRVIEIYVMSLLITLIAAAWFLSHKRHGRGAASILLPITRNESTAAIVNIWKRRKEIISYWGIVLINTAFTTLPYIILPYVVTMEHVGLFAVCQRIVGVAATIQTALAAVFGPRFAELSAKGADDSLRREFRSSQLYSSLLYLPLFIMCVMVPSHTLHIFGGEYVDGRLVLVVLGTGRMLIALCGLSDYVLIMSGRERFEALNGSLSLLLFIGTIWFVDQSRGIMELSLVWVSCAVFRTALGYAIVEYGMWSQRSVANG